MKRQILVSIICIALFCFTGCSKKEAEAPVNKEKKEAKTEETQQISEDRHFELKKGIYFREYEEEFLDGVETFKAYVYFGDEGKGFIINQDDIVMSYADGKITSDDGLSYTYEMTDANTVKLISDYEDEYTYLSDEIPEDVNDEMYHNPDGTIKVNNREAADSFYYLITSDTITFYSTRSTAEYVAEEADLDGMEAAYVELRDNTLPVLFVRTKDAPKEVGYEHALQYLDGKIYNNIGADKIEEVYKNASVIVASVSDDSGEEKDYYRADDNNEFMAFAVKKSDGTFELYNEDGTGDKVSEEDFNAAVEEAIGGDTNVEINWRPLAKAVK